LHRLRIPDSLAPQVTVETWNEPQTGLAIPTDECLSNPPGAI